MSIDDKNRKSNRLINEKSPYLLQHAHNPVDWYPWGEEAFEAAREQDKPIFLSIGYSTCHWCHVMEHESFEDSSVAALMNDAFINIKVDREERPDIDDIYMTVCQMLTQSGGWPLTIVMTPEKQPFYAATYLPRETRFQRMGMLDLVPRIKEAWQTDRKKILASAEQINGYLTENEAIPAGAAPDAALLDVAYSSFKSSYDPHYGGFGSKPKFPTAHNLMFLLRRYQRTGEPDALAMVENTLTQMRYGGMFDHVGFGFHRYSTDEKWLVPHFEKMLYDQAILVMAYAEAFQITGNPFYEQVAREILTYVLRDMTDANGGFYSAEDADSEGEEGKFYTWSEAEILQALGAADGELYNQILSFQTDGNFVEEATGQRTGTNIPHLTRGVEQWAVALKIDLNGLRKRLEGMRRKLFDLRENRIHPLKDDKILTDWNGLMIAALSKASQAFQAPEYAEAAQRCADFVLGTMRRSEDGRLMHRYREGAIAINGYLDDYAFMIWGLIELYETRYSSKYLAKALELNERVLRHFQDEKNGAFFFTADDAEKLLVRKKSIYDGAIPSGNSVMMLNLLRLSRLSGNVEFEAQAEAIGAAFSSHLERYPAGYTLLLIALDFATGPTYEVVISGKAEAADTGQMLSELQRRFIPNKTVLFRPSEPTSPDIAELADYTREMTPIGSAATAYVCKNFACELPTDDPEKMLALLKVLQKPSAR